MDAGIDFGSTLVKAYWVKGGAINFATGAKHSDAEIAEYMRRDGVSRLRVVGTGRAAAEERFPDFNRVLCTGDPIADEITMQAAGVRYLLDRSTRCPSKFIIASIGTGVSYTMVKGNKVKRSPLGSAHGGGTIMGLAGLIGILSFTDLEAAASGGTPQDLLVKHQLPETDGTPLGELIIAHFNRRTNFMDASAGILSFAAASIFKDIAVLRSIPFSPKEVVFIGSPVSASPTLRAYLRRYAPHLKGTTMHFLEHGEFSAAIGAYLDLAR